MILLNLLARVAGAILLVPPDVMEHQLPMMAPLPTSLSELRRRRAVDRLLDECWASNNNAGYEVQACDNWLVDGGETSASDVSPQNHHHHHHHVEYAKDTTSFTLRPSTYGEVTNRGARQLFDQMGLNIPLSTTQNNHRKERDHLPRVFVDLGSGAGRLVAHACLEVDALTRAIGVELSPSRHESALHSIVKLREEQEQQQQQQPASVLSEALDVASIDNLQYLEGDLFEADTSMATHIYVSSLCFTDVMMHRLETKLIQERRVHQRLQVVASLRKFPTVDIIPHVHYIEMTWTKPKGSAVYFYDFF